MITHTIHTNYGWREIREHYNAQCRECDKFYPRTVSTGFNDLADHDYIATKREKLKQEAVELSAKKIVCSKCTKAKLKKPEVVRLITAKHLQEIAEIEEGYRALNSKSQAIAARLRENDDRLFYYEGSLYAQSSAEYSDWHGGFTISGPRMSKTRPWETTDDHCHGAKITEIQYCNVTRGQLKKAAKG